MKRLEILHKGNTQTLLTVAPDRVSIKFKEGLFPTEEIRIKAFLTAVAERCNDAPTVLRGTLKYTSPNDPLKITMKSSKNKCIQTFSE